MDILRTDSDTYKRWIEFQMAPEMNWSKFETADVQLISFFDVVNDEGFKEVFNWGNTQTLLKQVHLHKGTKYKYLDDRLQFVQVTNSSNSMKRDQTEVSLMKSIQHHRKFIMKQTKR